MTNGGVAGLVLLLELVLDSSAHDNSAAFKPLPSMLQLNQKPQPQSRGERKRRQRRGVRRQRYRGHPALATPLSCTARRSPATAVSPGQGLPSMTRLDRGRVRVEGRVGLASATNPSGFAITSPTHSSTPPFPATRAPCHCARAARYFRSAPASARCPCPDPCR